MEDLHLIASHVESCFDGFHKACDGLRKADISTKRKILPWNINDELGRFRLWCGNAAAHRRGKSSLDYKLREASHIRDRVLELLKNLCTVIQEANEIITGQRVPWDELSDSDSEISDDELPRKSGEETDTTELQQLMSNIAEIVTCLMRLSMAIRNPAPHDQFKESKNIDTSHYEAFDIDHVRGKFPRAEEYLVIRLGKAISRRRQYLQYRDEHQKKLKQGLEQPESAPDVAPRTIVAPSEKIESTVASSIPLTMKATGSFIDLDENNYYEDALSQTSYASSTNDPTKLRPPPLPEQGQDGTPFECPLCFRLTSVRQVSAWHKHVYRDLHPYVCSHEECKIPDTTYESRHDWFNHELHAHRVWWQCIESCDFSSHSKIEFRDHLSRSHPEWSSKDRQEDLMRTCERQQSMDAKAECPLCQHSLSSFTQFRRHLGKHHEELALFALPSHKRHDQDENDIEDGSDSRSFPSSVSLGRSISAEYVGSNESIGEAKQDIAEYLGSEDPDAVFQCLENNCGETFPDQNALREHSLLIHKEAPIVECRVCLDNLPATKTAKPDCGHHICYSCLKRLFTISVRGLGYMASGCCLDKPIPVKHVEHLFDDKFKRLWNKRYRECIALEDLIEDPRLIFDLPCLGEQDTVAGQAGSASSHHDPCKHSYESMEYGNADIQYNCDSGHTGPASDMYRCLECGSLHCQSCAESALKRRYEKDHDERDNPETLVENKTLRARVNILYEQLVQTQGPSPGFSLQHMKRNSYRGMFRENLELRSHIQELVEKVMSLPQSSQQDESQFKPEELEWLGAEAYGDASSERHGEGDISDATFPEKAKYDADTKHDENTSAASWDDSLEKEESQAPKRSVGDQQGGKSFADPGVKNVHHKLDSNSWFISGEGIAREVITAGIQRYLGSDAIVKPFSMLTGSGEVVSGYQYTAPRPFTDAMIEEIRADSARWRIARLRLKREQRDALEDLFRRNQRPNYSTIEDWASRLGVDFGIVNSFFMYRRELVPDAFKSSISNPHNEPSKDASYLNAKKESEPKKANVDSESSEDESVKIELKTLTENERRKIGLISFLGIRLQEGLLTPDQGPKEEEMAKIDIYLRRLETLENLEAETIRKTKVHAVLKAIVKLNSIPKEDEFNFKSRSQGLLARWGIQFAAGEPSTNLTIPEQKEVSEVADENAKEAEVAMDSNKISYRDTDQMTLSNHPTNSAVDAGIHEPTLEAPVISQETSAATPLPPEHDNSGLSFDPMLTMPTLYGHPTPGAGSTQGSVHTNSDKDPFLSLLEQLAEDDMKSAGPSDLDFNTYKSFFKVQIRKHNEPISTNRTSHLTFYTSFLSLLSTPFAPDGSFRLNYTNIVDCKVYNDDHRMVLSGMWSRPPLDNLKMEEITIIPSSREEGREMEETLKMFTADFQALTRKLGDI